MGGIPAQVGAQYAVGVHMATARRRVVLELLWKGANLYDFFGR